MTNQEIKDTGLLIRNEQQIGGNTALRVGGVIEGIGYALDNKDAANGYYQATISGGTITVNAPNYLLGSGGNLRIKMPSAGTGASTLTIGNANAVQLWYNGAAVSSENTWEAGEIISVFYDGTRFMASNSQGGGGKAEKISYDNSQSGLAANNVQDAIDETAAKEEAFVDVTLDHSADVNYRISSSTKKFTTKTSDKQRFVPVVAGSEYLIGFSSSVPWGNYSWVTDIHVSSGGNPSYCSGETNVHTVTKGTSVRIKAPNDAKFICITFSYQGTDTSPSLFQRIKTIKEVQPNVDELIEKTPPYYTPLTGSTVSNGEFQTSTNSYVLSSSDYGLWYDVTSLSGRKIKFFKGTWEMRVTFTNAILTTAQSNLTSYLLSNIFISDTDFELTIPDNGGNSVYLWVHYVKGGISRFPSAIMIESTMDEFCEVVREHNKTLYGNGGRQYTGDKINLFDTFNFGVNATFMNLDSGTSSAYLQGADVYGNLFFQFYAGGRCCVYNLDTKTKIKEFTLSNFSSEHFGSVHFSNEYPNTGELPLMYTESSASDADVLVIDINPAYNGTGDAILVRTITLTDYPYPNVCCAFDFSAGIGYMIGRPVAAERFGRYFLQPFNIQDGSYDINDLIDVKSSGPLQDATFRNGVIFVISGWNNLYNSEGYTNYAVPQRITAVNAMKRAITAILETGLVSSSNAGEVEGIGIYNECFYVSRRSSSTGNKLMKIDV